MANDGRVSDQLREELGQLKLQVLRRVAERRGRRVPDGLESRVTAETDLLDLRLSGFPRFKPIGAPEAVDTPEPVRISQPNHSARRRGVWAWVSGWFGSRLPTER